MNSMRILPGYPKIHYMNKEEDIENSTQEDQKFLERSIEFLKQTIEKTEDFFLSYFIYQKYKDVPLFVYINPQRKNSSILPQMTLKNLEEAGIAADEAVCENLEDAFKQRKKNELTILYQEGNSKEGYDFSIFNYSNSSTKVNEIFTAVDKMPWDVVKNIVKNYCIQPSPKRKQELKMFREEGEILKRKKEEQKEGLVE